MGKMRNVYVINPPKNVPKKTVPQTVQTQNQPSLPPYSAPIYLRVSKKLLRKLKEIDPKISEQYDEFMVDPVSGLVWIPGFSRPLTHVDNLRVLKAYILYSQHVRPFK